MITIHISDVKYFLECRQAWDWGSKFRGRLKSPMTPHYFTFGTIWHNAMAVWYTTYDQAQARSVIEAAKETVEDPKVDLLMMEKMLEHFFVYASAADRFVKPREVELDFSVPLDDHVRLEGTWDLVGQGTEDSLLWFGEHKTSAMPNLEQYKNDLQVDAYDLAGSMVHGSEFGGIMVTIARKKAPSLPRQRSDGMLWEQIPDCTYEIAAAWCRANHVNMEVGFAKKMMDELRQRGNTFFLRRPITNNAYKREAIRQELIRIAWDMFPSGCNCPEQQHVVQDLAQVEIYRSPQPRKCNTCAFRVPCIEKMQGGDWRTILKMGYTQNERDVQWPLFLDSD